MDLRQVVASLLTFSMFMMLGNMIKRDHFDSVAIPATSNLQYEAIKVSKQRVLTNPAVTKGSSIGDGQALKPCWKKPSPRDTKQSNGFITFSLTHGPEYHMLQVADAVKVATYLGATLVLPGIRGTKGEKRNFEEIYDAKKFVESLGGIIRIAKDQPAKVLIRKLSTVRVPNGVTEGYVALNVEPLFKTKGMLKLETNFHPLPTIKEEEFERLDSFSCLAMFGTLELQPGLQEVIDLMIFKLRALSQKSGQFIAVDLKVENLESKECQESEPTGRNWCYNVQEIGGFLKKVGFQRDTTIYVTQSRWHTCLDPLRLIYPKTYTKDELMAADKKASFLKLEGSEFAKVIDFYMCSQSDVFVPAMSGLFYKNVVGRRIASGKTQVLVPTKAVSSSSAAAYISPYISRKSHFAYSCFCQPSPMKRKLQNSIPENKNLSLLQPPLLQQHVPSVVLPSN